MPPRPPDMRLKKISRSLSPFAALALLLCAGVGKAQTPQPALVGFARLPARTFATGPESGHYLGEKPVNGVVAPFASPPVQGISSILKDGDTLLALSDNGFGGKGNSADYPLRFYRLKPEFRTEQGGTGTVRVEGFVALRDPRKKAGFPLVADGERYPGTAIPVDAQIRRERLLTGADFDTESFQRTADGDFWIGDELGPFLLHFDKDGVLQEAPFPTPNLLRLGSNPWIQSPSNPLLKDAAPNIGDSGGFEALALSSDGKRLYGLLEKTLNNDADKRRLLILPFDPATRAYSDKPLFYRKENPDFAIGEMIAVNEREYIVIERDNGEGSKAVFKRLYLIDMQAADAEGFVKKTLLADLLDIADPKNLSGYAPEGKFSFPFVTIESVAIWDARTLLVANDNNFPGSAGRKAGSPDDTEFILIRLPAPLRVSPVPL